MNEAIEFHDSVLARIERSGDEIRLLFRLAYVHRSSGEPGLHAGTGWTVDVELILFSAHGPSIAPNLPYDVWDGDLRVDDSAFSNVVPLPLELSGNVSLRIELNSGQVVEATGTRAQLLVVGPYTFVEENESFE
jgi:hypothetical protein